MRIAANSSRARDERAKRVNRLGRRVARCGAVAVTTSLQPSLSTPSRTRYQHRHELSRREFNTPETSQSVGEGVACGTVWVGMKGSKLSYGLTYSLPQMLRSRLGAFLLSASLRTNIQTLRWLLKSPVRSCLVTHGGLVWPLVG